MTKRILATVLAFLMIFALTACSKSTGSNKEVKLRIISQRVEDKAFYDEFNAAFTKKYPNIKLQYDAVPTADYQNLLTARIASGDVDIFVSGGNSPKSAETQEDLTGQAFLKDFNKGVLALDQYDGKQYAMPLCTVAVNVFYNKQIFTDQGIEVPTTWDEFVTICDELQAADVEAIMLGGKDQWPINMVAIALETPIVQGANRDFYTQLPEETVKFSDAGWVEVFEKLGVLGKYFEKNAMGMSYANAPGLFAQGGFAMMIDGSWSLTQIEAAKPTFEVGAFLFPGTNDAEVNKLAPIKTGMSFAVNKASPADSKDAAMKWLSFFCEKENYQKFTDVVKMFPVIDGIKMGSPGAQAISDLLTTNTLLWENQMVPGSSVDSTNLFLEVIAGTKTPEEAATKLQEGYINSKPNWEQ